jgi:hypothetical protein
MLNSWHGHERTCVTRVDDSIRKDFCFLILATISRENGISVDDERIPAATLHAGLEDPLNVIDNHPS